MERVAEYAVAERDIVQALQRGLQRLSKPIWSLDKRNATLPKGDYSGLYNALKNWERGPNFGPALFTELKDSNAVEVWRLHKPRIVSCSFMKRGLIGIEEKGEVRLYQPHRVFMPYSRDAVFNVVPREERCIDYISGEEVVASILELCSKLGIEENGLEEVNFEELEGYNYE